MISFLLIAVGFGALAVVAITGAQYWWLTQDWLGWLLDAQSTPQTVARDLCLSQAMLALAAALFLPPALLSGLMAATLLAGELRTQTTVIAYNDACLVISPRTWRLLPERSGCWACCSPRTCRPLRRTRSAPRMPMCAVRSILPANNWRRWPLKRPAALPAWRGQKPRSPLPRLRWPIPRSPHRWMAVWARSRPISDNMSRPMPGC